ncbi:NAD(P)-dependent oxidoreductase [Microbacterium sp. STN6]|uniref:NAD-dependent epimerase/dehydratase family protein n=1 Tax=Microbacterium sp. STN6 TaxID=2995588 RepID=UPI0022608479|nr:NAD(P)-dependent oxidoreductase [Microbacterium sp. STN6]MCX7522511.1 NAD(P)-dependent oxidoreductase [Microbacterium sp. STN6]
MTGGSGGVGSLVRPILARQGHEVTVIDCKAPDRMYENEKFISASVTDREAMARALVGAELVVHLAGFPRERPWNDIVAVNIQGGYAVLDGARHAGVLRVLIASSVHAAGFLRVTEAGTADPAIMRPDTFYGVGKIAVEALASLYVDRFGMTIVSARILTASAKPTTTRALESWLSPADFVRLIDAAAALGEPGHHTVWAVSRNTRLRVDLGPAEAIGFHPEDDAERFAEWASETEPGAGDALLGGPFLDDRHPLGVDWSDA